MKRLIALAAVAFTYLALAATALADTIKILK
jgi:hypothetical protein